MQETAPATNCHARCVTPGTGTPAVHRAKAGYACGMFLQREINLGFMSMRHASLPERVAAAAAAGFDGLSLRADQWQQMQDSGWGASRVRQLLADHGMRVSEIEPMRFLRDDLLQAAAEMVEAFGAPRVQVTPPLEPGRLDFAACAQWLAKASRRLPQTQLAIEFLPPTDVPDAPTAQRLIDLAGSQANLGFCVDSWHVFRGGGLASLLSIEAKRVFVLQINDGPLRSTIPDYIADCLRFRLPCGEGEFDLTAFLRLLPTTAPINVEVINETLELRPPGDIAALLQKTTVAALQRAR